MIDVEARLTEIEADYQKNQQDPSTSELAGLTATLRFQSLARDIAAERDEALAERDEALAEIATLRESADPATVGLKAKAMQNMQRLANSQICLAQDDPDMALAAALAADALLGDAHELRDRMMLQEARASVLLDKDSRICTVAGRECERCHRTYNMDHDRCDYCGGECGDDDASRWGF